VRFSVLLLSLLLQPRSDRDRDHALILEILRNTEPLEAPRGGRLPLYLWPAQSLGTTDEKELERLVRELDARGMAAIADWKPDDEGALENALRLGRIQKRLGVPVSINATASTYGFFDGEPSTAHVDATGKPFFDESFPTDRKMGCPFALDGRIPEMAGRIRRAVKAYAKENIPIDFVYADWEIDGPIEWNGAWESSKRCARCRRLVPNIDDFDSFQAAVRKKRAELERAMLSTPILESFPRALVGNYGVYPNDGHRYWYDYYEEQAGRPNVRKWYPEFEETGFTFAMPVTYPWYRGYAWYDFENSDYRWFYNMLLVGTNAAKSTPTSTPIITFVHWHTTEPPEHPDPTVKQLGPEAYRELLWHLLLRGHDGLFLWSPEDEALEETLLVYQVYRESHPYREFLLRGVPVAFDVPERPGPVVSALKLGTKLLVRRTDFDGRDEPVELRVDNVAIAVPRAVGRCQVLEIPASPGQGGRRP
jgi:hypothetical protein